MYQDMKLKKKMTARAAAARKIDFLCSVRITVFLRSSLAEAALAWITDSDRVTGMAHY